MSAEIFRIRQEEQHGRYRLVLSGELDLNGAGELEAAITRLCKAGALEIEVDLREITFIDSSGVQAIMRAREQCAEHRTQFFLVPGTQPGPRRLFAMMCFRGARQRPRTREFAASPPKGWGWVIGNPGASRLAAESGRRVRPRRPYGRGPS
jgi:anti-anti-sigma factor